MNALRVMEPAIGDHQDGTPRRSRGFSCSTASDRSIRRSARLPGLRFASLEETRAIYAQVQVRTAG